METVTGTGSESVLATVWDAIDAETEGQPGPVSKAFLLAGRAHFTAENLTSGTRFTFRITRVEPVDGGKYQTPAWFAGVLVGSDNTNDYAYLGMVRPEDLSLKLTKASKRAEGDQTVRVLRWVLKLVQSGGPVPAGYAVHHEGHCGRCGRLLTVPSSIAIGLGPECAGKV